MNALRFFLAAALYAGTAMGAGAQAVPAKTAIALPSDPAAVVIMLSYHPTAWTTSDTPILTVRADGSFVAFGSEKWRTAEGKIPLDELRDVLRFIIDDRQFFEFNSADAKKGIEMGVSDGWDTVIRIATATKTQETRFYALSAFVKNYPTAMRASQLFAIETRLRLLAGLLKAGGWNNVDDAMGRANAYLKDHVPDPAVVLTREDFQNGFRESDSWRMIRFSRELTPTKFATIEVVDGPGQDEVRISVEVARFKKF